MTESVLKMRSGLITAYLHHWENPGKREAIKNCQDMISISIIISFRMQILYYGLTFTRTKEDKDTANPWNLSPILSGGINIAA